MRIRELLAQEPTLFLFRKLWRFSPGRRRWIVLFVVMHIIANCILLIPPVVFGALIREAQLHGITSANLPYVMGLLALLFASVPAYWAVHGPARVIERWVAFWAEMNYRRYLLGCVLDLGLTWHGNHHSGDTIDKVNKAGDGIASFGQNTFLVIDIAVKLIGTATAVCWFSKWIGAFAFALVILALLAISRFDKLLIVQYRGFNQFSNLASARVFDALSNITTAKILHIEQPLLEGVMARFTASLGLFRAHIALNEWKWLTGAVCFQCVAIIPVAGYVYHAVAIGKPLDAGAISTLYMYLSSLITVYSNFSGFHQQIIMFKSRVLNASDIEQAVARANLLSRKPVPHWHELTVRDFTFSYAGTAGNPDIRGLTLKIRRGERIALIGESGAGKSTFLKVLHGMYANACGTLSVDGGPPSPTCFADLDLKTMLVPQEPEVFSASISENITLGMDHSEAEVLEAARLATFDKVLAELPRRLESVINENGVNLSGGQKQRLALARALLFSTNKDIVLLDESTSSVDPRNETEIYKNIWIAFQGKTVVACIHKMNLLKLFDRIVIFAGGQIVDEGTFDGLLKKNASFRSAWKQFIEREAPRI
jgi:ATP-binding cassette subfamily B protein